jgi:uncharacterized protein (TIGR02588 family)
MTAKKNPLEWTVFAVSLAVIATVVGVLVYTHATGGSQPPHLVVTLGAPVAQDGHHAVPLVIENRGDVTAENVQIEVTLSGRERAEVHIAFVPHGSRRRAWVTFREDPSGGHLQARVLGYEEP